MKNQRGFTLVEIILVTAIIAILLGFITINLVRSQSSASLASTADVLIAELKQQQLKAMIGDTEGSTSDSYGVHFDINRYVLFHGSAYSEGNSTNVEIDLPSNMQFNNSGSNIIFQRLSGQASQSTIELIDTNNTSAKRIHVNVLGTVTEVESL